MEYYGYAGGILHVDLTSGSISKKPLDLELAQRFIGGWGINYRLAWDYLRPGTDPFSPDNPIVIGVGPLVGTLAPSSSKVVATTKFPVPASENNEKYFVATSVGGSMRFGLGLKNAGYDHVVITGRAEKPCYLKIIDDDVEICDASEFWGKKDAYETRDELKRRHKGCGVWAIGKAAENLVRFAIGTVDRSSLGGDGGAAVLGSKNLKAIVAYGTKGVRVSDRKRFMAAVSNARERIINRTYCTDVSVYEGPAHSFGMSPRFAEAYPPELYRRTNIDILACSSCVCGCRASHEIKDGDFAGQKMEDIFYIHVPQLGQRLRLSDYRESMKMIIMLNKYGLNIYTSMQMIAFVTRLYARGDITKEETDGLELRRDLDCYLDLIDKIANREGFGNTMADGWYALSKKVGISPWHHFDGTGIVKGVDAAVDARSSALDPTTFEQVVNPRGGHEPVIFPSFHIPERSTDEIRAAFQESMALTDEEIDRLFTAESCELGRVTKLCEDAYSVYNCVGVCASPATVPTGAINIKLIAELYSAATGIELNPQELRRRGERVWNLYKLLNVREGFTREDDAFPPLWVKTASAPVESALGELRLKDYFGKPVILSDLNSILDDYYRGRGWSVDKGIPTKEKLTELELEEFTDGL